MQDEFETKIPRARISRMNHLNRQIPPEAHTPMYKWHKYWSRKTWNVLSEFIKTYCPDDGIVFDPFAGSGVVATEALKQKKRVIVADINPIATEITRLTIKPISEKKLLYAFHSVEKRVKDKILKLYSTQCRKCKHTFPITCAIWTQERKSSNSPIKRKIKEIRYKACPQCGDRRDSNTPPEKKDREILDEIGKEPIDSWYPKQKLYHTNGKPFMKKEKYESVNELFTKRNLKALALLMEAIEKEPKETREFLKIAFSSMVHLCSAMLAEGSPGYRPFSGVGWNQQSLWFVPKFMESNVWEKFKSAITGTQGLLNAKKESNQYFKNVKFGSSFEEVIDRKADIYIYSGSSFDLMEDMYKHYEGKGKLDYIFTDPPYDASVQYGELSFPWIAWLKMDKGYLERIRSDEVIRNRQQEKDFSVYHSLLSRSFDEMYKVLKADSYLTVTFHNPTFKVRNSTIRAGVLNGFELEKIHHQELARPSAKSLLQPFGSAQGDFYLRFYKPDLESEAFKPETIDEARFETIVVDTVIQTIAERGEETPYTILINAIDPELARRGFFSELNTGLDVKTVLEKHLGKEFSLIEAKRGSTSGKLWWFKNPNLVHRLEKIPLTERVEQTILRKLQQKGRVTFTEMWNAVSIEFPNSLTSDQMSIKDALNAYAKPVSGGYWIIKPDAKQSAVERDHTTMIAFLADIGTKHGYKVWIGKVEQTHEIKGLPNKSGTLQQHVTYKNINGIINASNHAIVADIDVLWVKNNKIIKLFEVESTTSMTSALQRGSNIDSSVSKYILIPESREKQLSRKLKSPMFAERFESDHWNIVYFNALREEYSKRKGKTNIDNIINRKIRRKIRDEDNNQLQLV